MNEHTDTAEHVTDMPDGSHIVMRVDPLADHHLKLWADYATGSTLLGYVVSDPTLLPAYAEHRAVAVNDPLFVTRIRQMYHRTF